MGMQWVRQNNFYIYSLQINKMIKNINKMGIIVNNYTHFWHHHGELNPKK